MTVNQRFTAFLNNLKLTDTQRADGTANHKAVRKCLNAHYWGVSSETSNSMLAGSWGKGTEMRPPRDVDVLFRLPDSVYTTYQGRTGNRQSQILQEVKGVLTKTYSNTKIRGDGQVVVVSFTTFEIEVAPVFLRPTGQYYLCNTHDGGSYKTIDPVAEMDKIQTSNTETSGNTRDLARMLKRWQKYCTVDFKSFVLELLAVDFLSNWEHKGRSAVYYDYMTRDFFQYILNWKVNSQVYVPGTYEIISLGDKWKSKAESALFHAKKACDYEAASQPYNAGSEWQQIFGIDIPTG